MQETQKEEILNINWHLQKMVLKALNTSPNTFVAAKKLGVAQVTVRRYKKDFNIKPCSKTKLYVSINN